MTNRFYRFLEIQYRHIYGHMAYCHHLKSLKIPI